MTQTWVFFKAPQAIAVKIENHCTDGTSADFFVYQVVTKFTLHRGPLWESETMNAKMLCKLWDLKVKIQAQTVLEEPISKWCCHPRRIAITLLSAVCFLVLSHWPGRCGYRCGARTTVLRPSDSLHWRIQKLGRKDPRIYWSPQRRSDITYRISLFGAVCSQTFHQVITIIILSSFSPLLPLKKFETCCVCKWVIREKFTQEGNIKYDRHFKNWVVGALAGSSVVQITFLTRQGCEFGLWSEHSQLWNGRPMLSLFL